ncbi:MAG: hypothetical protein IKU26_07885 [Clostridia bacterium]|nr:hypothetical protein [Clostridia bacterium]
MSKTWSGNWKCCATCTNWAGPRVEKFGSAETPEPGSRGKCYANVFCGVTQGPTAMDGANCAKYQKWAALR